MFNEQLLSEEEQVKHCLQVEGWRVRQSKTVSIVFKVSFYMQFIEWWKQREFVCLKSADGNLYSSH